MDTYINIETGAVITVPKGVTIVSEQWVKEEAKRRSERMQKEKE